MAATDTKSIVAAGEEGGAGGGVSLGKGAWDCDTNSEIPPEKEAFVFEEIATMDYPFEGIPTIPPRKDMDHMAFFCGGCRYRVTAYPDWTAEKVSVITSNDLCSILLMIPVNILFNCIETGQEGTF